MCGFSRMSGLKPRRRLVLFSGEGYKFFHIFFHIFYLSLGVWRKKKRREGTPWRDASGPELAWAVVHGGQQAGFSDRFGLGSGLCVGGRRGLCVRVGDRQTSVMASDEAQGCAVAGQHLRWSYPVVARAAGAAEGRIFFWDRLGRWRRKELGRLFGFD